MIGNPAIIWTIAGILGAACFARGLKMKDNSRVLAELLWYTFGAAILAGAAILWISMEKEVLVQYRIVLALLGAIFGALSLLSIGEWIRPIASASAQTPQVGSQPAPNFNFQAPSTNQFNFGAPPQTPARDPDTLYQLQHPVGQVERAAVDVASSTVTFDLIRGAMNLNVEADFEYRQYILHITQSAAEMGQKESPQGRWIERRLARVTCRIVNVTR
jgi:hypothetical protein